MATNLTMNEVKTFADFMEKVASILSADAPIRQAQVLFAVAMAGEAGIDSATLEKKLQTSAASISRTVRVLSKTSYDGSEGYGLIGLELDPADNRKRVIKINTKGRNALGTIVGSLRK